MKFKFFCVKWILIAQVLMLAGCTVAPPKDPSNACHIFDEYPKWYRAAKKSSDRWGVPISTLMAFVYKESTFDGKALPPRKKILGLIPAGRSSTAFGYSQALRSTWDEYKKDTGRWFAERDNFDDAIDFVGWYNNKSMKQLGLSNKDPYSLYLVYHEGPTGYRKKTYKKKRFVVRAAGTVKKQTDKYSNQMYGCRSMLAEL